MMRRVSAGLVWLPLLLLAAGCKRAEPAQEPFPDGDAIPGWRPAGEVQAFDTENLYDLVNGQADSFFVYGFEQVYVQSYVNAEGGLVRVEVWWLDKASNAYGLYTVLRGGEPIAIGNAGDTDPGRRVDFWQDRAFVRVFSLAPEDTATLEAFAAEVANRLPTGGREPALLERLPDDDLVPGSEIFFHQEISIQDYLWLGGQNLLSLGADIDAVLARYEILNSTAWLLLVEYPADAAASAALETLAAAGLGNLRAATAQGALLGAVFGDLPGPDSEELLGRALDGGS